MNHLVRSDAYGENGPIITPNQSNDLHLTAIRYDPPKENKGTDPAHPNNLPK